MTFDDVIIVEIAVVSSHLQCGVTHKSLKGKRIAAAIHQILAGEGVTKRMDRSPLHTSGGVVPHNRKPQSVLCEQVSKLVTEQIIVSASAANNHVIPKNCYHGGAEGDDLDFAVLRVPENDLFARQIYILILDVSHCGSPTTAVQKEIDNDPIPIFTEVAI